MRAVIFRVPGYCVVGALAALAAAACNGGGGAVATCASDAATFACSPVDADAGGCAGNAPDGAIAFYPLGCTATFPGCGGSATGALSCTCAPNVGYGFGDAQAVFVCGN